MPNGQWCREAKQKADHLADTFKSKYRLVGKEKNDYSEIEESRYRKQTKLDELSEEDSGDFLKNLRR